MTINKQKIEEILNNLTHQRDDLELSLHIFDIIPSTNQKLWELLDQGLKSPRIVLASRQTAGRGQWGRTWQSESGGLYLSLGIKTQISASKAAQLTLCSAWGIATTLRNYQIPALLKWPNDLILEGRKLGGIKIETRIQQGTITQAVIGVGINWTNPVPKTGINLHSFYQDQLQQAIVLCAPLLVIASLEQLAAIVIDGLLFAYQYYLSVGIEAILPSYLELNRSIGRQVSVNGCSGEVVGVTSKGELQVRLNSVGATTQICLQPGTISLGYD